MHRKVGSDIFLCDQKELIDMGQKNRTDNDIVKPGRSRFSPEQRAKMQAENSRAVARKRRPPAKIRQASSAPTERRTERNRKTVSDADVHRRPVKTKNERTNTISHTERRAVRNSTSQNDSYNSERKQSTQSGSRNENVRKSVKARKKNSRLQNTAVMGFGIFLAVSIVFILFFTIFFKITEIQIVNDGVYSDSEILEKSDIKTGSNLLLVDKKKVDAKLRTELPYIEKAEIKKQLPDKLMLSLTYAEAAMAVDTGGGYVLMNSSGKVLEDDSKVLPQSAAIVNGLLISSAEPGKTIEFKAEDATKSLIALSESLKTNGIENVTAYNIKSIADVRITVDCRIEILLGGFTGSDEKLSFGSEVIKKISEKDNESSYLVDLRDPTKAYVRNKNDGSLNYIGEDILAEETESFAEDAESQTHMSLG